MGRRVALVFVVAAACGGRSVPPKPPAKPSLPSLPDAKPDKTPTALRVLGEKLDLTIDPDAGKVGGAAEIELELAEPTGTFSLAADGLEVEAVTATELDGRRSPRMARAGLATELTFDPPLPAGKTVLAVRWKGIVHGEDVIFATTHVEGPGRPRLFPVLDERAPIPWRITVRIAKGESALSNGAALGGGDDGNRKVVRFAETEPMPARQVAIVTGPFEMVSVGPRLRLAVPRGRAGETRFLGEVTESLVGRIEETASVTGGGKLDVVLVPGAGEPRAFPGLLVVDRGDALAGSGGAHRLALASGVARALANRLVPHDAALAEWLAVSAVAAYEPRWRADARPLLDDGEPPPAPAVLRMIEGWVGRERFLDALRARQQLGGVSGARDVLESYRVPGVPRLDATLFCPTGEPAELGVTQRRPSAWHVPVCVAYGRGGERARTCALVGAEPVNVPLGAECPAWVFANAGGHGVYRVRHRGDLVGRLMHREVKLEPGERQALLEDARAFVQAGEMPLADAVALAARFGAPDDPWVTSAAASLVELVPRERLSGPARAGWQRLIHKLFGARARALGLVPRAGESAADGLLRPRLIAAMAVLGDDAQLIKQAEALAGRWIDDRDALPSEIGTAVLVLAARGHSRALFGRLRDLVRKTKAGGDRAALLAVLGSFDELELGNATLTLVREVDLADSRFALTAALASRGTRDLAYDFVKQNWDDLAKRARPEVLAALIGEVPAAYCDRAHRNDAASFFSTRAATVPGGADSLARGLAIVDACMAGDKREAQALARVLKGVR